MMNTEWSETDLAAAADRVQHAVSRRVRGQRRTRRIGLVAGIAVLGAAGVAAASTALPPQNQGEIGAGASYAIAVKSCLAADGWNVWVAPSTAFGGTETVHFSVSGYEQIQFMNKVESCRIDVARRAEVPTAAVIGLP